MKVLQARISQACGVMLMVTLMADAHELDPAVADLSFVDGTLVVEIELNLEAIVAGIGSGHDDTEDSPEATTYNRLRGLSPDLLDAAFVEKRAEIIGNLTLDADGAAVPVAIDAVTIPEIGDVDIPRLSRMVVQASLPDGAETLRFGWSSDYGEVVVRTADAGEGSYAALLQGGQMSDPIEIRMPATGIWDKLFGLFGE